YPGVGGGIQNGCAVLGADLLAIDGEGLGGHGVYEASLFWAGAAPAVTAGSPFGSLRRSSRYSSRKNLSVLTTGLGAFWPRPHKLVFRTMSQSSSSVERWPAVASRCTILSSRRCICTVPARQGTHLPHDSSMQNSMKYLATSGMRVDSSITIMPPEPMIEPRRVSDSYSPGGSISWGGMHPPDAPPVCTALIFAPSGAPPPISSTICLRGVPIGTSIRPVLAILPASANTFVPLLLPVPMAAYQSAPLRMIGGMFARVSTLLISVGQPQRPLSAGKGGRGRGGPRLPSIEAMRVVSSPQT